jgi:ParB family transcriptional regulator, chromosome partitioning protein
MAVTKKGLGRGLSALIPDSDMEFLSRVARGDDSLSVTLPAEAFRDSTSTSVITVNGEVEQSNEQAEIVTPQAIAPENTPVLLDATLIEANPYQPRRIFAPDEMRDLVASVREHGIIQPILVRPKSGDSQHYQLIAGERRWRAAQEAGLAKVPVVIRDVSDQQALELALIENVQRHDISVMDAARAYRRLAQEFSLSQDDIARRVGKSRPSIANTMRLLDLPEEAQKAIEDGVMTEGHGRAILLAPGDGARRAVFRRIMRDKVTVREAEELSRRAQSVSEGEDSDAAAVTVGAQAAQPRLSSAELRALRVTEEELSKVLGTRVRIRPRAKGGQITIEYFSGDDLDHLLGRLRKAGG